MRTRATPINLLLAAALAATPGCAGVDPQDTASQLWQRRASMPDERTEVSATTDGRLVYVAGGFGTSGQQPTAPRPLFAYDPAADAWSTLDSIPEGVNHAGFVHLDGRLYLVGGFREATFEPTGAVRVYDLASRTWTDGTPMPTPRGALAVVVLAGRIHAIGGNAANAGSLDHADHGIGGDGSSVGTHEVYDPQTNTWSRLAPLPTPRNHLGAAVAGGRIHAVGGRVGNDFTMTTHEVYNPAADAWTAAPPLPTGRSGIAVVEHRGQVYVFGGETAGAMSKTFDEAERFDPAASTWQAMPRMPTARHGLGAAAVGATIYVLSGGPRPGFAFSSANEALTPEDG
jgi:N-acetylneuraminic acid mutarotase